MLLWELLVDLQDCEDELETYGAFDA